MKTAHYKNVVSLSLSLFLKKLNPQLGKKIAIYNWCVAVMKYYSAKM